MICWAREPVLNLRIGRDRLSAEALRGGAVVWAAEATYVNRGELVDAIARLASEAPGRCRRLVVALERPPVQLRTLSDLPPVKPRELRALIAHQAGRFFRRNGLLLVTDAARTGTRVGSSVRAAAVEEPLVEAVAAGARAAGLILKTIAPADEAVPLALLPTSERARRERAARGRLRRLALAAGVAWFGAAALFGVRLVWERRTVERELAALERPLAVVLAARRELRDAEAAVEAVSAAERLRGRSLAMLDALTRALPDSAVLTSLVWSEHGSGVLTAAARRAAEVVADLERAHAVSAPRLQGPVVREPLAGGTAWERFTIVFGDRQGGRGEGS